MCASGLRLVGEVYDADARRDVPAVFALLHLDLYIDVPAMREALGSS